MTRCHPYTLEDICIDAKAPQEEINALIGKMGAIVLKGLLSKEEVDQMLSDFQPHLDALGPSGNREQWDGSFFPPTSKKVPGLLGKSDAYVHSMALNPVLNGIADHALTRRTKTTMSNPERYWSTCRPQLNVTGVLEVNPGGKAQDLHRDDAIYHDPIRGSDVWDPKQEKSILALAALTPVTPENGGTLIVPGSHIRSDDLPPPTYEDAISVRADPGDCVVILCSVYHAGGANKLEVGAPNSIRTLALCGWSCGYLKQEENQYLQLTKEEVMRLPVAAQRLAGWEVSLPYLGYVNWEHPLLTLGHPRSKVPQLDDLFYDKDQSDERKPYLPSVISC
ncbi:phytanoyl-CoA dioxygenase family protein [Trichosporon asahii var. asahii CBS 8904]|uniref:Phytanoyl-CoA dioxygenase family protein n=2 Tax=Trichosporon asahii var. asahii TaxID=189963 RepID=K1WK10_TRIAC|nr:phytanoyl-CoA dioxygenase family protein [Trichosporon asahii var. asahii CBS 2479]EJT50531.1 phytanoyl-CoA dioxygenase family protein [Trichosporon asahii var. asahii CBS 2479]EKD01639.1 phytanoyl-CoA dioxygenase family protein [Trichosporon asahii var. asahii CBS 8904]